MKIDTEELHERIDKARRKINTNLVGNSFEAGYAAGALSELADLKIELMEWELQERTKGNQ